MLEVLSRMPGFGKFDMSIINKYQFLYKYSLFFQILFDFSLMFKDAASTRLVDDWPKVHNVPFVKHNVRIDTDKQPILGKINEIYDFLTFLRLIPTSRVSFEKAVNSFLTLTEVKFEFIYCSLFY